MSMLQKIEWVWPNNQKVEIRDWVRTLSQEEQTEFFEAQKRQIQYRKEAIEQGRMVIDEERGYVWKNEEEAMKNKPTDPVWEKYFKRWCQELGIQIKVTYENIP